MDLFYMLMSLENRIERLRLKRTKKVFLTCRDIQKLMREDKPIPTNIFNAERKEYIVKSRTIYGSDKRR